MKITPFQNAFLLLGSSQCAPLAKVTLSCLALLSSTLLCVRAAPVVTPTDGDWSAQYVKMENTPEADLVIRVGDIDNLGFGWQSGFDPFSGSSTGWHNYPWNALTSDAQGTDRIMVVSSFNGIAPYFKDGYTTSTTRPKNVITSTILSYDTYRPLIYDATIKMFVDDLQAPLAHAIYQVTLNGKRFPAAESIINSLSQTGPIGKLITLQIPSEFFPDVASGRVELKIDDPTTGTGDGYAIDFVKLLINKKSNGQSGTVGGRVIDIATGLGIEGVVVTSFSSQSTTSAGGYYTLTNVPAGYAFVKASATGYLMGSKFTDVLSTSSIQNFNFELIKGEFSMSIGSAIELNFQSSRGIVYMIESSPDLVTWTDDEAIIGTGRLVKILRSASGTKRFWRAKER